MGVRQNHVESGLHSIHKRPRMASCLAHMDMRQSMRSGDAFETTGAMHRHGQVQSDEMGIAAVRRSIEVTTNNRAIAKMPSQRCNGQSKRVLLIGGWGQGLGASVHKSAHAN